MKQPISKIDTTELTLTDKLIYINRVAKVMKGGKRLRFSALVTTCLLYTSDAADE